MAACCDLSNPIAILITNDELIVSNFGNNTITSYLATAADNAAPIRRITQARSLTLF